MHNGVPWHVAAELPSDEPFILTAAERIAAGIIFGTFEGGVWSWEDMNWVRKNGS